MKHVVCAVLAAGGSSRLGRPKQLVEIEGQTLVHRVASRARLSSCESVALVVGAHGDEVAAEVRSLPISIVRNPEWASGLSSSIREAVKWANDADALVVVLGDQPHITADHIDRLVEAWKNGAVAVASFYGGKAAVPAIFDRQLFDGLLHLDGDAGAARLLRSHSDVTTIPWPEGEIDVDTEDDVAALEG